jgi:hypothetical protein
MRRTAKIQNDRYTTFRTRLHQTSLPECRSCHEPIHTNEGVCPWCGAKRATPATGITQPLPRLPEVAPWYHEYAPLVCGLFLVVLQARAWLWLWPLPQIPAILRTSESHINLFYYAVGLALATVICFQYRLTRHSCMALLCLLLCWAYRALIG